MPSLAKDDGAVEPSGIGKTRKPSAKQKPKLDRKRSVKTISSKEDKAKKAKKTKRVHQNELAQRTLISPTKMNVDEMPDVQYSASDDSEDANHMETNVANAVTQDYQKPNDDDSKGGEGQHQKSNDDDSKGGEEQHQKSNDDDSKGGEEQHQKSNDDDSKGREEQHQTSNKDNDKLGGEEQHQTSNDDNDSNREGEQHQTSNDEDSNEGEKQEQTSNDKDGDGGKEQDQMSNNENSNRGDGQDQTSDDDHSNGGDEQLQSEQESDNDRLTGKQRHMRYMHKNETSDSSDEDFSDEEKKTKANDDAEEDKVNSNNDGVRDEEKSDDDDEDNDEHNCVLDENDLDDDKSPITKSKLQQTKPLKQAMQNAFTAAVKTPSKRDTFISFVQCMTNSSLYICFMACKGSDNTAAFKSLYRLIKAMTTYPLHLIEAPILIDNICELFQLDSPNNKNDHLAFVKPLFDSLATVEHRSVTNYFPIREALSFDVGTSFICPKCDHKWHDYSEKLTEMFLVIQLPTSKSKVVDLDECIKTHIGQERDKRPKACPSCKEDLSGVRLHKASMIMSEIPPMLVICLSQASSNARATRKIKIKANTHFNMLVGDDTTTGRYSLQALLTHDDLSSIVGRRHRLSQSCPSTAVVMSKQQRNASGATTSFPNKKKQCWLEYCDMSYNKKQASFLQSGNISMLWYARDGYDWHAHAKEVSPFRGKSPRSIPKSNNTSGESRPVPLNRNSIESEKMNYAEDWRISTRSQEQELIQWFTEYIPTKRFDSRPRCILPSGHETSPLTSQQRTYMSKRLGQCVGALISNDAQLNENARVRVKKKRTKVPKILKQSFPSIDNEIAVVDATHAHLQDIDSFEFKNMSQIKNNKILFTASLKSSRNVQNIIWQNINAIFQKLDGKQLTADISKESTQAFCFCHVTSSAIFIYAAVVFDVCSMDVVKSVDDFGPKSAWVIKWLYTKASFRGLDFGKRLLQLVLKYQYMTMKANNIILAVDTNDIDNRAKPWYESLGFLPTTWDACSKEIQEYATCNRYNIAASKMIPFQVQSNTSLPSDSWEVLLEFNRHTVYTSMLIYEARIVRGGGGRDINKTKSKPVPSLPCTRVMVTALNTLLKTCDASKWPTPNISAAHFQDALNGFKNAAVHNMQSIMYAVQFAAYHYTSEEIDLHKPKNVVMYYENKPITEDWVLHKNYTEKCIRMPGKCRIDPILRQIARGSALRLSILQHAILETFHAQETTHNNKTKHTKKIRSLELQMLQQISWTPLWNIDTLRVKFLQPTSRIEQRYNIYCHHCNQFLLCHSEGTLVRTLDLKTIRALTPLVVTKHFNLDIGSFSEYTEQTPDRQTRLKKPTETDACFNDLFMDLNHYSKTLEFYSDIQTKTSFIPVPLCSIFDVKPSAECIKFGATILDAMRCDSFVEKSEVHIKHCNALSYALFVAGTDEEHQVSVHGPNNPALYKEFVELRSKPDDSPKKRSDKNKDGQSWENEYKMLDNVSSQIMPMFHHLFEQLWTRSVHAFMPTLFDIYDYTKQNTQMNYETVNEWSVLIDTANRLFSLNEGHFRWLQDDMNVHNQSWVRYKDIFKYIDEMNYDSPFGRADQYHDHLKTYNEEKFKLILQGNQKKVKKMLNGSLSSAEQSKLSKDERLLYSTIAQLHIPKVDTTPTRTTIKLPARPNKTQKTFKIVFPNPDWMKHRPLMLDDAPKLSSGNSEAEGWDDENRVKKILGPMYWSEKKNIKTHTSVRNAAQSSHRALSRGALSRGPVTNAIEKQAAAEKLEILLNKRMENIVAVVHPKKLHRHLGLMYRDSIIEPPLSPFLADEKYQEKWKRWPLFIVQSNPTDEEKKQFPSSINWRQRTIFVLHARILKHIKLSFLEDLVTKAKSLIDVLPAQTDDVLKDKSFPDFQPLPSDFVERMNESVTAYNKHFIQQVKPGSLFPIPTAYVSYEMTTNKFYQVRAIDTNDVFDDDDIFAQDALKTFMFCHTDTKLKLHEGRRIMNDACAHKEPPSTHPSHFILPFQFSNAEGRCVFGAFLNLLSLFDCNDIVRVINTISMYESSAKSPFKICLEVLNRPEFRKQIQYKKLYFNHDTNDVELLDDYRATCNMPIIVTLNGSSTRAHCVSIFRDQIIDGLYSRSLPYSEANLRYTLGDDEVIYSIESGIMLKPSATVAMQYLEKNPWDNNFVFDIKEFETMRLYEQKKKKMKLK